MNISENFGVLKLVLKKYGFVGFIKMIWTDVFYDYRHGVDTFSSIAKKDLFEKGKRLELQNRYVPSTFSIIEYGISKAKEVLGDDVNSINFIDYGSGKGKVLIVAARYGFKKCIGIEYSLELHKVAEKNMEKLGLTNQVELIQGDALNYIPSPDDRVLYFFNPFMGGILETCLQTIKSISPSGKRVLILVNTVEDASFSKYFKKVASGETKAGSVRYCTYTDY